LSRGLGVVYKRQVEVKGEDELVRCTALAVAFRTDRWHLGEDQWPPEWRAEH
jgi:hypothetical protein